MNVLIALAITLAGVGMLQWLYGYRLPGPVVVGVYVALYFLVARLRKPKIAHADEPDPDYSHWPTSGPIGRFGQRGLLVPWTLTNALSLLNPFQAIQIFRQVLGNARLAAREERSGDDGTRYRCKIGYSLPVGGEWLIYNGGITPKTSHSWHVLGQRFALDMVKTDPRLRRHRGRGTSVEEYHCYGQPVLAAADGVVVVVQDGIGIAPFVGWGICDFTARHFAGNHVMIRHAEGEYGFYAHLMAGSILVAAGDAIPRGQVIGRCGHTGHSSEPHLHFHLQDSENLFEGMGLPIRFTCVSVDGCLFEEIHLVSGQFASNQEEGPSLSAIGSDHPSLRGHP